MPLLFEPCRRSTNPRISLRIRAGSKNEFVCSKDNFAVYIVIYGAGPVGLMAAMSARIQSPGQIFIADGQDDHLDFRLATETTCP